MIPAATLVLALLAQVPGLQLPRPTGHVNDFANVLPADAEQRLDRIAAGVRGASGGEIAVVTMRDLQGRDVSDVALEIGRQWGVGAATEIGDRRRNAGAVVLIVPKETAEDGRGRCWVSTGQGTEGFIIDADAGTICREAIPYFQRADYGRAVELVTYRVAQEFAQEFAFSLDSVVQAPAAASARQQRARRGGGFPWGIIVPLFFFLFVFRGGRRRRRGIMPVILPFPGGGWGGGGFGGGLGGGGFGGGGFGGFGGGGGFSGGGGGSSW